MTFQYDFCVIGAGIVGLAVAHEIKSSCPSAKIIVLEKEIEAATHQTGHNSGVIHAGIYYAPGSLKASLCAEGLYATKEFCKANMVPYNECGKLIVSTNAIESNRLEVLYERSKDNGLSLSRISAAELNRIEPNIVGKEALFSPETAIVDYREICKSLVQLLKDKNVDIAFGQNVNRISEVEYGVNIQSNENKYLSKKIIVCGGLQSDRLAKLAGMKIDFRIVPFRGEYYSLSETKSSFINHLIYPVPDPDLPFLGVHLTKMIDGGITVGPNAVIGFARENYKRNRYVNVRDVSDYIFYSGFWALMVKNYKNAFHELRGSVFKKSYLEACRKYAPTIELADLRPFRPGIRAQAVHKDGTIVHDFLFEQTERMLHVCNAPSPAATSAFPIARMIVQRCLQSD